jgi:hypothetical protein
MEERLFLLSCIFVGACSFLAAALETSLCFRC